MISAEILDVCQGRRQRQENSHSQEKGMETVFFSYISDERPMSRACFSSDKKYQEYAQRKRLTGTRRRKDSWMEKRQDEEIYEKKKYQQKPGSDQQLSVFDDFIITDPEIRGKSKKRKRF